MAGTLAWDDVAPYVRGRLGQPYRYEPECESTQLLLLEDDLPEGAVAATDHQTAGRGRLGRPWQAPPGTSLLCSVLLHPPPDRRLPELTVVGAVAAAEAVEAVTDLSAQIKWPNDVMLNRRKVAGILGELREERVVLGIGINVNQTRDELPADVRTPASSLRLLTGRTYDRGELLGLLLARLEHVYDGWRHGGIPDVYAELGPRDFLRGRTVHAHGLVGVGAGVDRQGRLVLDTSAGPVPVEAGDVTYDR